MSDSALSKGLLTVNEAAERLKCHPHTVRRWIWKGKIAALRIGDLVRIPATSIDGLLEPARPHRSRKRKNVRGLLDAMEKLRGRVDPADVVLMEQFIREAEQPADWSDPFA